MKVFAVYGVKGGVGKTATAVILSYISAQSGARTLLWDMDPQGGATYYFRVKPRVKGGAEKLLQGKTPASKRIRGTDYEGLDLLPSDVDYRNFDLYLDASSKPRRRIRRMLEPLEDDYDYVFLDCAPTMSLVSESVFGAVDALVVPTIPTTLSIRTLDQIRDLLAQRPRKNLKVLPFHCMVDRRKSLHRNLCADPGDTPYRYLDTPIPYASDVEQMGIQRAPLPVYAPRSRSTRAYQALWQELLART